MLRNHLKIALRRLLRDRTFSLLNLVGLAVGLATTLLIFEFIAYEWSANRFHANYATLYRLVLTEKQQTNEYYLPPGWGKVIREKFADVRGVVRVAAGIGAGLFSTTGMSPVSFRENQVIFSDGDFFRSFTFPFVSGSNTLDQPQTLALSASFAQKLFGNASAVGKTLNVSNQFGTTLYTVTGVFADFPANSDLQTHAVLAFSTLNSAANRSGNDWADPNTLDSGFINLYFHLNETTNPAELEGRLTAFLRQADPEARDKTLHLQPFRELHLAPTFSYPFQTYGSLTLVVSLGGVALLVLLIAWVNYVNLSTAQALRKAKEVGVRKVIGAQTRQLMGQFLTETALLSLGSVVLGVLMALALQEIFNEFTGKNLSLAVLGPSGFWLGLLGLILLTALFSGGYVAFALSRQRPIVALRGQVSFGKRQFTLRQVLVVFQFGISVVFIVATLVMYQQLQFMRNSTLGLKLDQLLVMAGPSLATDDQSLKNDAFTQGRTFTKAEADASWNNAHRVIVNESAARQLGFDPKGPVAGQRILWGKEFEIVGVVKDYHHLSMHQAIDPVIYLASVGHGYFTVKTDVRELPAKLATLENLYKRTFPGNPFDFFFADEAYDRQFRAERQLGQVFVAASLVAILIACLGIFGLAAFAAQQRTKEIGVRKVLGASVGSIVALLSKDFLKLVAVAIVIASPLAWYLMNGWLQDFAYKISIEWWVFALAGFLAVGIALLTVSFQSVKAALANPVKSLRTE